MIVRATFLTHVENAVEQASWAHRLACATTMLWPAWTTAVV